LGKKDCVKPQKFVKALCRISKRFLVGKQEDAHELLMYLVDTLHEETKVRTMSDVTKSSFKDDKIQEINPELLTQSQGCHIDHRVIFDFDLLKKTGRVLLERFHEQE
jgi:ubiquitin C-terminal hydrolase